MGEKEGLKRYQEEWERELGRSRGGRSLAYTLAPGPSIRGSYTQAYLLGMHRLGPVAPGNTTVIQTKWLKAVYSYHVLLLILIKVLPSYTITD